MNKRNIVLDTNVYISSVFWEGTSYKIITKALNNDFTVIISVEIIKEIEKVLKRDFKLSKEEIDDIIYAIRLFTLEVKPRNRIYKIKEDPDDNMVLECAVESKSKYIVSQDKHLLNLGNYKRIKILDPEQFLKTN